MSKGTIVLQPLAEADRRLLAEVGRGLGRVSGDNLHAMIEALTAGTTISSAAPLTPLETVQALAIQYGVRRVLRSVEKKVARQLQEAAGAGSQAELAAAMEAGLLTFFSDRCPVNTLRLLCGQLGLDALPRSDVLEASEREHQLADELVLGGTEALLLALPPTLLRVLAKELQVDLGASVGGPEEMADAIMQELFDLVPLTAPEVKEKRRLREREERRRPASDDDEERDKAQRGKSRYKAPPLSNIKKGITKQELHDLFNLTNLQDYCRENGLDLSGKKALLIRRILHFLETGDRGQAKPPRKRKH